MMMRIKTASLMTLVSALITTTSASALTFSSPELDFRETYLTGSELFQTKLQISTVINDRIWLAYHNTVNHGSRMNEFKNNYSEVEASWFIPITDKFAVIPDVIFNWGKSGSHIDPYLKANYQFLPAFGVMVGYRYYHNNFKSVALNNEQQRNNAHEYNLWLNWQINDRVFANYNPVFLKKQNDFHFGNNKKTMWQHTLYVNYKYDQHWTPYVDVSDLGRANNGKKEYRSRVGIKYTF
ncbi:hypothetical protein C3408_02630 [Candidatus Pantoea alvi]|nr:hypothetical protein C3408_02630 [Pantoea alvi]UBN55671.1 hypothetical protein LB453_09055 [Pantoea agglomerans]